jgi:RNA polymerase sigma factor (sigma-70 family)
MSRPDSHRFDAEFITAALHTHEAQLVQYVYRFSRDIEQARDVVQEAFLKLLAEDRQQIEGHLVQWLYQVCRNRALDIRKKENRMKPMSEYQMESIQNPVPEPDQAIETAEIHQHIQQQLSRLPANQQEVIRLKFQQGLSYKQISQITHLSISNVGFLIHTGIKSLRSRMAAQP